MFSGSPQWQAIRLAWSRLIDPCPVLVMISNGGLVCCWKGAKGWMFRSASWSQGACRDGMPQQREAIAELIADLLFDLDLPGAELVLCLPPPSGSWCVIDGLIDDDWNINGLLRDRLGSADLPFDLEQSYLMTGPIQDSVAVAGVARSLVQAWIDVVESADLPLRRISWSLMDAQRALVQLTQDWSGDLAWLLVQGEAVRLILMRDRVPEVDHALSSVDPEVCVSEARSCLQAWQETLNLPGPVAWWLTLDDPHAFDWFQVVDAEAGEQCLNKPLPWSPEPWSDTAESDKFSSLAHLALSVLHEEESW